MIRAQLLIIISRLILTVTLERSYINHRIIVVITYSGPTFKSFYTFLYSRPKRKYVRVNDETIVIT
jgi:hypothetical protein